MHAERIHPQTVRARVSGVSGVRCVYVLCASGIFNRKRKRNQISISSRLTHLRYTLAISGGGSPAFASVGASSLDLYDMRVVV
jgi:hypothetical protein